MTKVGEHVTFDIVGTQKEYDPKFYEKSVFGCFLGVQGAPGRDSGPPGSAGGRGPGWHFVLTQRSGTERNARTPGF